MNLSQRNLVLQTTRFIVAKAFDDVNPEDVYQDTSDYSFIISKDIISAPSSYGWHLISSPLEGEYELNDVFNIEESDNLPAYDYDNQSNMFNYVYSHDNVDSDDGIYLKYDMHYKTVPTID